MGSVHIAVNFFLESSVSEFGRNFIEIENRSLVSLYLNTVVIDLFIRFQFVIQQFNCFFVVVVVMYLSHGFQVLFGLCL